jgi:GT2 family glycosyltransferase
MAAQPDLSVVLVTHNGREMALRTLASAREHQGAVSVEWFVVDSGSGDGTPDAIAAAWPDIHVTRAENRGFAAGNNLALPATRGRYVLLLNPDVTFAHGSLELLVRALDERPDVGAAGVRQLAPDGTLLTSIRRFPSLSRKLGEALGLRNAISLPWLCEEERRADRYVEERSIDWTVGAFLAVRREALEQVGRLDERFFLYSEETDWCYRIRAAGWDIRHLPQIAVVHYGSTRPTPELRAQLSWSKILFARKHFGPVRAAAVRAAIATGHALRVVAFGALAVARASARPRRRAEVRALRVTLGLAAPPYEVRSAHPPPAA